MLQLLFIRPDARHVKHLRNQAFLADTQLSPLVELHEVLVIFIDAVVVEEVQDLRRQLPIFKHLNQFEIRRQLDRLAFSLLGGNCQVVTFRASSGLSAHKEGLRPLMVVMFLFLYIDWRLDLAGGDLINTFNMKLRMLFVDWSLLSDLVDLALSKVDPDFW